MLSLAFILAKFRLPHEAEGRMLGFEWSYAFTGRGVNAYVERQGSGMPNGNWWPMSPLSELGGGK